MAKQKFPPTETKNEFKALGHAKDTGSAQDYTEFRYPEGGGNDIGVYKQPMPVPAKHAIRKDDTDISGNPMDKFNIAVGGTNKGNYTAQNKNGEKTMRGYGAATKGIKTRGPMA
jgi:hypothetical protein